MDESVIKHLEQQQVGKLKLSAAIRIGCMMRPWQCFGMAFEGELASCVIGAAADGFGIDSSAWYDSYILAEEVANAAGVPYSTACHAMTSNDVCRETREQIADWLEAQGY